MRQTFPLYSKVLTKYDVKYYNILIDLVFGEVHRDPAGVAGILAGIQKRMATIRKLILCMCYKNGLLKTCQTSGIAVDCPNPSHFHCTVPVLRFIKASKYPCHLC